MATAKQHCNNSGFGLGRDHSPGVDGRRRSVVRGQRSVGVPGQGEGHAKGAAAETGTVARQTARERVKSRRAGG